jgi:murein DD-endopeptidase MepM/ murein hydrolase activator NlpD
MVQKRKLFLFILWFSLIVIWLSVATSFGKNSESPAQSQILAYNPAPPAMRLPETLPVGNILHYDFKNGKVAPAAIPCKLAAPLKNSRESELIWPTYGIISSCFYAVGHTGLDIANTYDIPVLAAHDGLVYFGGRVQGYGNQIKLQGSNGWQTHYAHLNSFVAQEGEYVRQGQLIGYMGNTGNSTGPHLHFELLINEKFVDPLPYLPGEP